MAFGKLPAGPRTPSPKNLTKIPGMPKVPKEPSAWLGNKTASPRLKGARFQSRASELDTSASPKPHWSGH